MKFSFSCLKEHLLTYAKIVRAIFGACLLAACQPAEAPAPDSIDIAAEADGMPSRPRAVDRAMPEQDFRITVVDDPEMRSFKLTLTSRNTERELCVGGAEWPDERGRLESAADSVFLYSNGEVYAMRDSGEQCGVACVRRIAPGASLDGIVSYAEFVPEAFDGPGPRRLDFGAQPYFCDTGEVE